MENKTQNGAISKIVIDAKDTILGRLASYAAKQALLGKEVIIVNCNDIAIAGNRDNILKEYLIMRQKDGSNLRGPFFPKVPEKIMKRTIRGMLKYKKGRGEQAFDKITCYNKVPAELESATKVTIAKFSAENKNAKTMKLSEVAKLI
jgi:large subunit ribosomal protein L13